ncbi:MAG: hypothetical protein ACJAYU_004843 [Bradymonadia bacterium]
MNTRLICRESALRPEAHAVVQEVFAATSELPHLHSKCYLSEHQAIVCSLNLYDVSSQNLEMGIVVPAGHPVYAEISKAVAEYHSIAQPYDFGSGQSPTPSRTGSPRATKRTRKPVATVAPKPKPKRKTSKANPTSKGFCIRCADPVKRNEERPFCISCYRLWAEYENPNYREKHCHGCGGGGRSLSFTKPLCGTCYSVSGK